MHLDGEHPTDITMSRVRLASDTCDIHSIYIKVNHLLYAFSLDYFEDGILLDTPLVCIHRYCRNIMDEEEEGEHKCTTTPSARKAWKRRKKRIRLVQDKRYYRPHQAVLPLKAHKPYYRPTSALLPLNPTNSCDQAAQVRYYRTYKRYYR